MARTTRTSRPRRRTISNRPTPVQRPIPNTPVEAAADAAPPVPVNVPTGVPRTARAGRTAVPAAPRGLVTDYGYVVGELRRIVLLTVGIFVVLFALWFLLR